MDISTDNKIFTEMKCGMNFAYILNDNSRFLTTEYKVLQSQAGGCFLHNMKMTYNGKTELYYMTDSYKAFSALVPILSADRFLAVARNLLEAVDEVKNNGFLTCSNLDISFERIYIDTVTYKVRLVYLPVEPPLFSDETGFENELRAGLIQAIDSRADKDTPELRHLSENLSDGTLTLEETAVRLRDGTSFREPVPPVPEKAKEQTMYLVTMNAPRIELKVTKDEFIVGKKVSAVDGAVTFNPMISRLHCKVSRKNGRYEITDLKSANGTYINQERLTPERAYPVKNGDVVRLADTDFQVSIR